MFQMARIRGRWAVEQDETACHYQHAKHVSEAEHAGHVVVMDASATRYFGFTDVGARIWSLLRTASTPRDIAQVIASEYEVPIEQAQADVLAFLKELVTARLVQREEAA